MTIGDAFTAAKYEVPSLYPPAEHGPSPEGTGWASVVVEDQVHLVGVVGSDDSVTWLDDACGVES